MPTLVIESQLRRFSGPRAGDIHAMRAGAPQCAAQGSAWGRSASSRFPARRRLPSRAKGRSSMLPGARHVPALSNLARRRLLMRARCQPAGATTRLQIRSAPSSSERCGSPACLSPESEIVADHDSAAREPVHQEVRTNSSGVTARIRIERENRRTPRFPAADQMRAALVDGGDQRGARVGATTRAGCGSKVRTAGFEAPSRAATRCAAHDAPVPAMNAIEVPDREGGGPKSAGTSSTAGKPSCLIRSTSMRIPS